MSETEIGTVVEYIFSMKTSDTLIGRKLREAATTVKTKNPDPTDEKEELYKLTISDIKRYDATDNICWVDYRSWVSMPKSLQKSILDLLEPKSWRGVIFRYDQWTAHEHVIVKNLHEEIVLVLARDQLKKYRLYTIPLFKSYLDWMSPSRYRDLTHKITNNAIKTYGRHDNAIYILDREDHLERIPIV